MWVGNWMLMASLSAELEPLSVAHPLFFSSSPCAHPSGFQLFPRHTLEELSPQEPSNDLIACHFLV